MKQFSGSTKKFGALLFAALMIFGFSAVAAVQAHPGHHNGGEDGGSSTTTTTTASSSSSSTTQTPAAMTTTSTSNSCQNSGRCSTSFLVLSVGQGGATVVISSYNVQNLVSVTNNAQVTGGICAVTSTPAQFGCMMGETGQFTIHSGQTYWYTVTFHDGRQAHGSINALAPATVQVVNITPQ